MAFFNPINPEFKINNSTNNRFTNPDVGVNNSGTLVVVWEEEFNQTSGDFDIKFRRFLATGETLDSSDRTVAGTTENEIQPSIAVAPNRSFVVTYVKNNDIFVKRFDTSGNQIGNEILVSTFEQDKLQSNPKIAIDSEGDFTVVWTHQSSTNDLDIRGRTFFANGNPRTDDLPVAASFDNESEVDIAMIPSANNNNSNTLAGVITYTLEEDGNKNIYIQRFGNNGNLIGDPIIAVSNQNISSSQRESSVAIGENGNFVVSWTHEFTDGDSDIHLRRFSANGNPLDSTEIIVDNSLGYQNQSSVALSPDGTIVVTYQDINDDLVKYRQFSSNGNPLSDSQNYAVNSGFERNPDIAISQNNTMVIVADDDNSTGTNPYGRIFKTDVGTGNDPLLKTPLNRFQNSDRSGTYLFAGEEESNGIRRNFPNFIEEGLAFRVSSQPADGLIRINRFQNSAIPGTYLFAGEQESQNIRRNFTNFVEEGVAFYVYEPNANKGVDFYRFQNTQQPGTYIFVGEEEKNNILANFPQFTLEGVAFEVG